MAKALPAGIAYDAMAATYLDLCMRALEPPPDCSEAATSGYPEKLSVKVTVFRILAKKLGCFGAVWTMTVKLMKLINGFLDDPALCERTALVMSRSWLRADPPLMEVMADRYAGNYEKLHRRFSHAVILRLADAPESPARTEYRLANPPGSNVPPPG